MAVPLTISLVGLLIITGLAAGRWSRSGPGDGPGRGQPEPIPIRSTGGPNGELFRILDDPRFGELRRRRPAHRHDHRPGAA